VPEDTVTIKLLTKDGSYVMPHNLSKLAFDHTLFANICSKRKAQLQCNIICEMSWH